MKIFNKSRCKELLPLIKKAGINTLFAQYVLEERVEGRVYVDNCENPRSIYIRHPYGMTLLYGELEDEQFNREFLAYMLNKAGKREGQEWMQVYPVELSTKVEELLGTHLVKKDPDGPYDRNAFPGGDENVLSYERVNFAFNRELFRKNKAEAGEVEGKIVVTDEELFNSITGSVIPAKFWDNSKQFVERGKGFTLLDHQGEAASTAFAAFICDDKLELGIETAAKHHGKGYAHAVSAALIEYCLAKGFLPVWACHSANIGSRKLAEKLGFVESKRLPYYRLVL